MADDPLNYQAMTEDALRGVVRQALGVAVQRGLVGQHHFYLTFRTAYPGVEISAALRERHPEEMTIVIQHQFWGLEVTQDAFAVTLSFNGQHERLRVPLAAVSAFVDPSVQFGLQFSVASPAVGALPAPAKQAAAATDTTAEKAPEDPNARVVTLDAFRKSDARKK